MNREGNKFYSRLAEMICKKKTQLQGKKHMDAKKNCPFIDKFNWNINTWKRLSFSEWQPGDGIMRRHVHEWISIEHVDQQDNIWCETSIKNFYIL